MSLLVISPSKQVETRFISITGGNQNDSDRWLGTDNLGIVVKDIEKAIKHFHRIGLESVRPTEIKTVYTASIRAPVQSHLVQNKAIRFDLIQPETTNSIFSEYLNKYGEGLIHVTYRVKDLAMEKARLVKLGVPILATTKKPDNSEMEIFFDTRKSETLSPFSSVSRYLSPFLSRMLPIGNSIIWDMLPKIYSNLPNIIRHWVSDSRSASADGQGITTIGDGPVDDLRANSCGFTREPNGMCSLQNKTGTVGIGANAPFVVTTYIKSTLIITERGSSMSISW